MLPGAINTLPTPPCTLRVNGIPSFVTQADFSRLMLQLEGCTDARLLGRCARDAWARGRAFVRADSVPGQGLPPPPLAPPLLPARTPPCCAPLHAVPLPATRSPARRQPGGDQVGYAEFGDKMNASKAKNLYHGWTGWGGRGLAIELVDFALSQLAGGGGGQPVGQKRLREDEGAWGTAWAAGPCPAVRLPLLAGQPWRAGP